MPPPHDDDFYDDEPRGGRRKGLLTVVAVLGLAVVGTAGAFGYRSMFGGARIVAAAAGDPRQRRAEQGRAAAGDARPHRQASSATTASAMPARTSRSCEREEKPVDLSERAAARRACRPAVPTSRRGNPTAAANPPSAIGEPRRVRTVPIRPEQGGDVATSAAGAAADHRSRRRARPTQPRPPRRRARRPARDATRATPAPPPAAPLSPSAGAATRRCRLSPDASRPLPPPPAQDVAPPPPPRARRAPPPRAWLPRRAGSASAAAIWCRCRRRGARPTRRAPIAASSRNIRSVLGSQPHRSAAPISAPRASITAPWSGRSPAARQAVQLCSSLKQAGGDCVVQH